MFVKYMNCKYFLHFSRLPFPFVGVFLYCAEAFRFYIYIYIHIYVHIYVYQYVNEFRLFIFTLLLVLLVSDPLPRPLSRKWPAIFSLGVLWVQVLHSSLAFNPVWVNFCVWWIIAIQFNFFAFGCSVFSTPFNEYTVLPSLYILGSFVIN